MVEPTRSGSSRHGPAGSILELHPPDGGPVVPCRYTAYVGHPYHRRGGDDGGVGVGLDVGPPFAGAVVRHLNTDQGGVHVGAPADVDTGPATLAAVVGPAGGDQVHDAGRGRRTAG